MHLYFYYTLSSPLTPPSAPRYSSPVSPRAGSHGLRPARDPSNREIGVARVQILGDEIQNLRTVESVPHRPALPGFDHRVCGFHRVADVLAIPVVQSSLYIPLPYYDFR